jgi:hypothetical protein
MKSSHIPTGHDWESIEREAAAERAEQAEVNAKRALGGVR